MITITQTDANGAAAPRDAMKVEKLLEHGRQTRSGSRATRGAAFCLAAHTPTTR